MKSPELFAILERLVHLWCDRRALNALRYFLAGYPLYMGTSDEWHMLWKALRDVRGLTAADLPDAERVLVEEALRIVDRLIRASGQVPGGPAA
jgi:hypothetical protein